MARMSLSLAWCLATAAALIGCPLQPPAWQDGQYACTRDDDCLVAAGYRCAPEGRCVLTAGSTDGGAFWDAGAGPAGGPRPADGGTTPEAGPDDAGLLSDGGARTDGGQRDGGPVEDGGQRDGGPVEDGGQRDGGPQVDAGGGPDGGAPNDAGGLPDAGRCVDAPTALALTCPDAEVTSDPIACTLSTSESAMPTDTPCVTCSAHDGYTVLSRASFEDGVGGCDLQGWSLVDDPGRCKDGLGGDGTATGSQKTCCTDLGPLCDVNDENARLRADKNDCGSNVKAFLLQRTFDLSGLRDGELCFSWGEDNATNNDGISVQVTDGVMTRTLWTVLDGPRQNANNLMVTRCLPLPSFTDDNPSVTLSIYVHSNDDNDSLYLDDVEVHAWPDYGEDQMTCPNESTPIWAENFNSCDGEPITDGFRGWNVSGTANCVESFECRDDSIRLAVEEGLVTLSRTVDLRTFDDHIELCFWVGDDGGDGSLAVSLAADGVGRTVYAHAGNFGDDGTCFQLCLDLSAAMPEILQNPEVHLQFDLATDGTLHLDQVSLRGQRRCPSSRVITLPDPVSTSAPDSPLLLGAAGQGDVELRCEAGAGPATARIRVRSAPPSP